jgi:virulence factor Mce-like protein
VPWFQSKLGRRLLGIGVIVGWLVVVLVAVTKPNPFKDTQSILARFDNVHGLGSIDRNVRIGGTNAGEIGDVHREGDDVIVELRIEPDIPVHDDARADLRPHTLFEGSAFVDLHPGSPSAAELEEGSVIPKSQTSVYVSLDEALRVLREPNRKALKGAVGSTAKVLRGKGVEGLRRTLGAAPELLRQLGPTARALRGPEGDELAGAIRGLAGTVAAVGSREAHLAPLVQRANRTLAALDTEAGAALDRALAALPGGLEELERGGEDLTRLVDALDRAAVELEPAVVELAPLLRDSQPLLRRSSPIIRAATPLISGLRTTLARAARSAPPIRKALENLRPAGKLLAESVLPSFTADGTLGIPVYAQLVQAFAGGAATARTYQTPAQNPNGAGHIIRAGGYLDPQGLAGGVATPSCALVAQLNPELADQLEVIGLCQP